MAHHWCPCPSPWESLGSSSDFTPEEHYYYHHRLLQEDIADEETAPQGETWQMVYVGLVLLIMFGTLLLDIIGADLVMLAALTACMASNIITVDQGLSGFSNEGVLTVLVLFVVAAGVELTGGLDWYMNKLLGRPVNTSGAQLRLMVPIAIISAFMNNTPVVVIMIPICQKWGKNVGISPAQLLMPLSFASILGGTCTLIGTSTNLVVAGLYADYFPDDPQMGLFDIGEFGIPIAMIGMSYIIIASPYLLPGGKRKDDTTLPTDDDGTILLGARLTKWSPAAGRTVKRSGLRDTGGVYLVSVYRAKSGNIHRAVGQEFVLNADDILYFTGMVDGFGAFCEENGLEVVTHVVDATNHTSTHKNDTTAQDASSPNNEEKDKKETVVKFASKVQVHEDVEIETNDIETPPMSIDTKPTRQSYFNKEAEKLQAVNRLTDMIRGFDSSEPFKADSGHKECRLSGPAKVVVSIDTQDFDDVVIVGVNVFDRPGLLLDISRGLHSLGLQLHHTEASVIQGRSISIWRCGMIDDDTNPDGLHMQDFLQSLLGDEGGAGAAKRRGLSVIRSVVQEESRLCDNTLEDLDFDFRDTYKAAVIAVQKKDNSEIDDLTKVVFAPGDILVLQANDESPLLARPPTDFYGKPGSTTGYTTKVLKAVGGLKLSSSTDNLKSKASSNDLKVAGEEKSVSTVDTKTADAWRDLRVLFHGKKDKEEEGGNMSREYLAAVEVAPKSEHVGRTVSEAGLDKQAGLFLVCVERKVADSDRKKFSVSFLVTPSVMGTDGRRSDMSVLNGKQNGSMASVASLTEGAALTSTIPIPPEGHLKEGDILWFAGPATAIADLRKIPGLVSLEEEEMKQINEKIHDRRLVQAVVAKSGPLTGKTAGEVKFRSRYGAAVIAVHRDGKRVQALPGQIKLQAGDVLLLEAGPTFLAQNSDNQHSFALISEVKDSKPPRLNKLIPALVLLIVMLIVVALAPGLYPDQNMGSLLVCGLVVSAIYVTFGILSQQEVRDAVNWDVYVTIASAFGIGAAMTESGLASLIADGLVKLGTALGIGHAGLYGAVYLATFLISNIATNNAAAALMFPIALDAARQTGADPLLMSYNLMLAASACFMSPFGYTTNLLIYGAGGYKVKDFVRLGTPMQLILWIITTVILSNTTVPWWVSWIWTAALFILVCLVFVFSEYVRMVFNKAKSDVTELATSH